MNHSSILDWTFLKTLFNGFSFETKNFFPWIFSSSQTEEIQNSPFSGKYSNQSPLVSLENIHIDLDGKPILDHFSFQIERGQRIALMGPSGVGKSTLLKVLAGLLEPTEGKVSRKGSVSMVFDQDALYPMLSCLENIELGIDFSTTPLTTRRAMAKHWIQVFDCQSFWKQKANTLSAGQRKRTGLARAMMKEPDLLLLDETFHALDESLRQQLMETLLALQNQMHFALVFSTHDIAEAEFLKAEVLILKEE